MFCLQKKKNLPLANDINSSLQIFIRSEIVSHKSTKAELTGLLCISEQPLVVLPLILVMLLSALPVMAAPIYPLDTNVLVETENKVPGLILTKTQATEILNAKTTTYPIWLAEKTYYNDADRQTYASLGAGWIKLLKSEPHGLITANPDVVAPLAIAEAYIAQYPEFAIPTYKINHVEKVKAYVDVPETQTEWTPEDIVVFKKNGPVVLNANAVIDPADPKLDKDKLTYTVNDVKYKVNKIQTQHAIYQDYYFTNEFVVLDAGNNTVVSHPAGGAVPGGNPNYTLDTKALTVTFDDGTNTGTASVYGAIVVTPAEYVYTTAETVYEYKEGVTYDADQEKIFGAIFVNGNKLFAANKDSKGEFIELVNTTTKDPRKANKLVQAVVDGFLIVVEKTTVPVTVNHHFLIDGEPVAELKKTTTEVQPKNLDLTVETVDPKWYGEFKLFTIDTAKTTVTKNFTKETVLTIGEQVLVGYTVDLYYTAGEGVTKSDVDAAFAGSSAGVQNQAANLPATAVALPATGGSDNLALLLSSAALVVLGFFFKK